MSDYIEDNFVNKSTKNKIKYKTSYSAKYEIEYPWVCGSSKGSSYAYCQLCQIDISISSAGGKALRDHEATKRHQGKTYQPLPLSTDINKSSKSASNNVSESFCQSNTVNIEVGSNPCIDFNIPTGEDSCEQLQIIESDYHIMHREQNVGAHSIESASSPCTPNTPPATDIRDLHSERLSFDSTDINYKSTQLSITGDINSDNAPIKGPSESDKAFSEKISADDLTCNICGIVYTQWTLLKKHLLEHIKEASENNGWQSKDARKGFRRKGRPPRLRNDFNLYESQESVKNGHVHNLRERSLSFSYADELEDYVKENSALSQPAINANSLHSINGDSHIVTKPRSLRLSCRVCRTIFHNRSDLAEHQVKEHNNRRPFQCEACQKFFTTKNHLETHVKHKHMSGPNPCQCPQCSKVLSSRANLRIHMRIHKGERPFKCPICNKAFNRKGNMQVHIYYHNGERRFTCEICGQSFFAITSLKRHTKLHSGERNFACEICGATYVTTTDLKRHKLKHEKVKPHSCHLCDKQFTRAYDLKVHIRYHNKELRYTCNICQKQFVEAGNFRRHVRRHTGERPYRCEMCYLSFSQAHHLKAHKKTHSTENAVNVENSSSVGTYSQRSSHSLLKRTHSATQSEMLSSTADSNVAIFNKGNLHQLPSNNSQVFPHSVPSEMANTVALQAVSHAVSPPTAHTGLSAGLLGHGCQMVSPPVAHTAIHHGSLLTHTQMVASRPSSSLQQYKSHIYNSNVSHYPTIFEMCPEQEVNVYHTH